jgi:hypothetical protein
MREQTQCHTYFDDKKIPFNCRKKLRLDWDLCFKVTCHVFVQFSFDHKSHTDTLSEIVPEMEIVQNQRPKYYQLTHVCQLFPGTLAPSNCWFPCITQNRSTETGLCNTKHYQTIIREHFLVREFFYPQFWTPTFFSFPELKIRMKRLWNSGMNPVHGMSHIDIVRREEDEGRCEKGGGNDRDPCW